MPHYHEGKHNDCPVTWPGDLYMFGKIPRYNHGQVLYQRRRWNVLPGHDLPRRSAYYASVSWRQRNDESRGLRSYFISPHYHRDYRQSTNLSYRISNVCGRREDLFAPGKVQSKVGATLQRIMTKCIMVIPQKRLLRRFRTITMMIKCRWQIAKSSSTLYAHNNYPNLPRREAGIVV